MLASYAISRTLTPITIGLLLKNGRPGSQSGSASGTFTRLHGRFERGFERMRDGYVALLTVLLKQRAIVPIVFALILALGSVLFFFVGRDFFPLIDGGQIQLHVGLRPEPGSKRQRASSNRSRTRSARVPQSERGIIVDNIGLPARSYNLAFSDGSTIGPNDGIILVSLQPGHAPTSDYVRQLRQILPRTFPEVIFYFQPADIVTQILNFGSPAQIDVRTVGYDRDNNLAVARSCASKLQPFPALSMRIFSRKSMLRQFMRRSTGLGSTTRTRCSNIATNVDISLSSSSQVMPNFWTDPASGIPIISPFRRRSIR